jgi:ornithine decarboxylase
LPNTWTRSASRPGTTVRPVTTGLPTRKLEEFLRANEHMNVLETPFVVVDLDVVAERYDSLRTALPVADVFYAVKANPAPEILSMLVKRGSHFDVASPNEIDMCLVAGADPSVISFGNTIKKARHIADAYAKGVRLFAFDAEEELAKLIEHAPDATVFCRVLSDGEGADWPLSRKFGCETDEALRLLRIAAEAGMKTGMSFHVGSQQRDLTAWDRSLAIVEHVALQLATEGHRLSLVNLGGGFPGVYQDNMPPIEAYGDAINTAIAERLGDIFGENMPRFLAEPGRYLVADAGVLRTEVVLVSRKHELDFKRWVYLDCGKFGGLAETMDEAIRYRLRTRYSGGPGQEHVPSGPVTIAGPTCDSADVLYDKSDYELPLALTSGDKVDFMSAGAYTTTYSAVAFNGFAPLTQICI